MNPFIPFCIKYGIIPTFVATIGTPVAALNDDIKSLILNSALKFIFKKIKSNNFIIIQKNIPKNPILLEIVSFFISP